MYGRISNEIVDMIWVDTCTTNGQVWNELGKIEWVGRYEMDEKQMDGQLDCEVWKNNINNIHVKS